MEVRGVRRRREQVPRQERDHARQREHRHRQHQRVSGGEDSVDPAQVEQAQRSRRRQRAVPHPAPVGEQQRRNEVARDHEEHADPELGETADAVERLREVARPGQVTREHEHDRQRAQPIERGDARPLRRARLAHLPTQHCRCRGSPAARPREGIQRRTCCRREPDAARPFRYHTGGRAWLLFDVFDPRHHGAVRLRLSARSTGAFEALRPVTLNSILILLLFAYLLDVRLGFYSARVPLRSRPCSPRSMLLSALSLGIKAPERVRGPWFVILSVSIISAVFVSQGLRACRAAGRLERRCCWR